MAVGVHKAGIDLLSGGIQDFLPVQGLEAGSDGGNHAVAQGNVRLVGQGIDCVMDGSIFDKHRKNLPSVCFSSDYTQTLTEMQGPCPPMRET